MPWFNIGSVDSFERNLTTAQLEKNYDSSEFIPVIYKSEIEASTIIGSLPTLLFVAGIIFMMRRSMGMFGQKGSKGSGLFGGVMQSPAKFINPSEIGVRFK